MGAENGKIVKIAVLWRKLDKLGTENVTKTHFLTTKWPKKEVVARWRDKTSSLIRRGPSYGTAFSDGDM